MGLGPIVRQWMWSKRPMAPFQLTSRASMVFVRGGRGSLRLRLGGSCGTRRTTGSRCSPMGHWFIPLESPFTAFHRELITAVGFQVEAGQDGTLYLTASELQGLSTREDAHPVAAEL